MPQLHCIYDDLYTSISNSLTVTSLDTSEFNPEVWERLISSGGRKQIDFCDNQEGPEWMSEEERQVLLRPPTIGDDSVEQLKSQMSLPREPETPNTGCEQGFFQQCFNSRIFNTSKSHL
jgi:hypothetical protein